MYNVYNGVLHGYMDKYVRSEGGLFGMKGDQPRRVRSLRLTDSAWESLGELADQRGITRSDLIEEIASRLNNHESEVIQILEKALSLKPNAGGAIKKLIRDALSLLKS